MSFFTPIRPAQQDFRRLKVPSGVRFAELMRSARVDEVGTLSGLIKYRAGPAIASKRFITCPEVAPGSGCRIRWRLEGVLHFSPPVRSG